MEQIFTDSIDIQLLDQLQRDASLSNQALAERIHISPPTCLRRVKRLREAGLIAPGRLPPDSRCSGLGPDGGRIADLCYVVRAFC